MTTEVVKYILEGIFEKYTTVNDYYDGYKDVFIDVKNYTSAIDEILRVFEKYNGTEPKGD